MFDPFVTKRTNILKVERYSESFPPISIALLCSSVKHINKRILFLRSTEVKRDLDRLIGMYPTFEEINFIISITNIYKQIFRHVPIVLILFGTIGNLMSCLVFTQRALRKNPCAFYFLIASISNIIYLTTLTSPTLDAWDEAFNLMNTVSGICKFAMLIIFTSRALSIWCIVFATIDRYLVSSAEQTRRQMSSLKRAYQLVIIACVSGLILWVETFYCFDANLIGTPIKCFTISNACRIYNDISVTFMSIIIPSMVMLIFGGLTILNIQQSRQRINPSVSVTIAPAARSRKTEQNFTQMLLTQVFLIVTFNLPHAIFTFYLTVTFDQPKTPVQGTLNGFIFNMLLLFPFISCSISFLLYTLTGKIFRQTLVQLVKQIVNCLNCQHGRS